MTTRLCKLCGREFEPQQARTAYCSDACRKEGERRANTLWARKDRLRRREAALRMAPVGIPRDRAVLVYASESRHFGPVVTEWRGTVPTALRFLHMPENGGF